MDNRTLLPQTTPLPSSFFNLHWPWKFSHAFRNMVMSILLNSSLFFLLMILYPKSFTQIFFFGASASAFFQGGFQNKWETMLFDYRSIIEFETNPFFSIEKPRISCLFSFLFACIETLRTFVILELSYALGRISGLIDHQDMPNAERTSLGFLFFLGVMALAPTMLFIYLGVMFVFLSSSRAELFQQGFCAVLVHAMLLLCSCPRSVEQEADNIDEEALRSIRAASSVSNTSLGFYGARFSESTTTTERESIIQP